MEVLGLPVMKSGTFQHAEHVFNVMCLVLLLFSINVIKQVLSVNRFIQVETDQKSNEIFLEQLDNLIKLISGDDWPTRTRGVLHPSTLTFLFE